MFFFSFFHEEHLFDQISRMITADLMGVNDLAVGVTQQLSKALW